MPITVSIVEDDCEIRESLVAFLNGIPELQLLGSHASAEAALRDIPKENPNVALMDIHLPGMSGIDCVARLKKRLPNLQILMLTIYEEGDLIFKSLKAGACGYLLKRAPSEELVQAVKEIHAGGSPMSMRIARKVVKYFNELGVTNPQFENLSKREKEVLDGLAQGVTYKEIAHSLSISLETVRMNVKSIYKKLHVHSRGEAVAKYWKK